MVEAEFDLKTCELEFEMAELAVNEAMVESEKLKLHLQAVQEEGNSREVEHVKLELRQAGIHVQMRKLRAALARLQIQRARARLKHVRTELTQKPRKRSLAQVEYLDDVGVVVFLGAEVDVEKIKALVLDRGDRKEEE